MDDLSQPKVEEKHSDSSLRQECVTDEVSDKVNCCVLPELLTLKDSTMSILSSVPWAWQLWLMNAAGMLYFLLLSLGALAVGFIITFPDVYRHQPEKLPPQQTLSLFIFSMLILNWVFLKYYSRHSRVKVGENDNNAYLPSQTEEARKPCRSCGGVAPPARAQHCPLCACCVLKRDHHCFFGGCCVGFHNQRYFVSFCLYAALGGAYSATLTFAYLRNHYADILSSQFYHFLLPWLAWGWWGGGVSANVCAMALFGYFNVMTFLVAAYYFCFQLYLLWAGQTSYEFVKGLKRYRYPFVESVRSVFGPWWGLTLFLPLPFLKSRHNGLDWRVVHDFKQL